jgi:hypothetical protein
MRRRHQSKGEGMTNEEIDRLLEQAVREAAPEELYKYPFARLVAAAEREACLKVCNEIAAMYKLHGDVAERVAAEWCADAIKQREKK